MLHGKEDFHAFMPEDVVSALSFALRGGDGAGLSKAYTYTVTRKLCSSVV